MKKLTILLTAVLFVPLLSSAQEYSDKIQEAYTQAEIEAIVAQDPNELLFREYMADRAASIQKRRGDLSSIPNITELNDIKKNDNVADITVENFDIESFNPLAYELDLENTVHQYRIGDTDRVVQILSENRTRHLFDSGQWY